MIDGPLFTIAIAGLAALTIGGVLYALFYPMISGSAAADKRLNKLTKDQAGERVKARGEKSSKDRRKSVSDTLKEVEQREKARTKSNPANPPLQQKMLQAGISWSMQTFYIVSAVVGFLGFVVCLFGGAPLYAAAAGGLAAGGLLPRWFVGRARKKRLKKFLAEFPNSVDVIVRGVKAGLPLTDCLKIIAKEADEPVKSEFTRIVEGQAMGVTINDAVAKMHQRVPLAEVSFFGIVLAIQSSAGGNLAEALENLSGVLRDRKQMKGKINAMSMEAKASAAIIGSLPIIVMILVYLTSPDYITLLFITNTGLVVLALGGIWMLMGILIMKKMINFDF